MRVLLAHDRYRIPGGEERHLDLLEEWLPQAGLEVGRLEVTSPENATLLSRVRLGLTLAYRPEGARVVREAIGAFEPDVVHFHNLIPLLTPAALREARRCGARVVVTVHNYRFACPAGTLLRNGEIHEDCIDGSSLWCGLRNSRGIWSESVAYGIAIEAQRRLRLMQRWVDAYVAPSNFVARMLVRAGYPDDRIHVVHHGTPVDETPAPLGDYALYAGRLSDEKGVRTLVAASALAPRVPLVIAGDGPLAPLVGSAESETLRYVGHVDRARVGELLRGSLFTVAPSSCYEVQPLGVLESLAAGRPVVGSRLGGLSEIVADDRTGILVAPNDPAALAAAMEALSEDRARAEQMGNQAWRTAQEKFSAPRQARRLGALYAEVLSISGSTHAKPSDGELDETVEARRA